jgi:putative heme-binding domain-containing protein
VTEQHQTNADASRAGVSFLVRVIAVLLPVAVGFALLGDKRFERTALASSVVQAKDKLKDPRFIAEGAKLFAPSCGNAYCHGTGGGGGGAPRLRGRDLEGAYVFKSISNGIPGTPMPSFKSELSDEQIWKLVAFIVSDAKTSFATKLKAPDADKPASQPAVPPKPGEPTAAASIIGSAQAGKALFFDSAQPKSCRSCHSLQGEGTPIGPDLSKSESKSPRELFLSIVLPHETKGSRYATVTLTLRNGDKVIGVQKEEDTESIRVYDTTELPAVLRTVQKADVVKVETSSQSVMPKDYATAYTVKQLLDLVTFLKSSESKSPVTLKDLFWKD